MAKKLFSNEFKAKVALAALKGHKTLNELATEFSVHTTQIHTWKKQLLDGSKAIFSGDKQKVTEQLDAEKDRLYAQIGKLQVELNWLKKKSGILA